jgi:hypothetical protein
MAAEAQVGKYHDALADILGRAFETVSDIPPATAELILRADFPKSDKDQVDTLLKQKAESGLSGDQEFLLDAYLNADLVLTVLKSKARQALRQPVAV